MTAGIGTYTAGGAVNVGFMTKINRSISQTIDSGLATSFDEHVMAGYRFLMRHFTMGDLIYIFGFSRGAFTARFLARMVSHVGLLSRGNDEMVPFAYKVYQDYEMGADPKGKYMKTFMSTFCQLEKEPNPDEDAYPEGVKVHFLGLFDTVNSVGTFDVPLSKPPPKPLVLGTARYVRHAVALDERRVKFKATLFAQDKERKKAPEEDVKEVWFPGNHGDIGGGWAAEPQRHLTFFQRLWLSLRPKKDNKSAHLNKKEDVFQLSDIALKWMADEVEKVEKISQNEYPIAWNTQHRDDYFRRFSLARNDAIKAFKHDTLAFGRGSSFAKAWMWKLMGKFEGASAPDLVTIR